MTNDSQRKAEIKKAVATLREGSANYGQACAVGDMADLIADRAVREFMSGDIETAISLRNLWSDVNGMYKDLMASWRERCKPAEAEAWDALLGSGE